MAKMKMKGMELIKKTLEHMNVVMKDIEKNKREYNDTDLAWKCIEIGRACLTVVSMLVDVIEKKEEKRIERTGKTSGK